MECCGVLHFVPKLGRGGVAAHGGAADDVNYILGYHLLLYLKGSMAMTWLLLGYLLVYLVTTTRRT
eukprot:COSAG06_NODE_20606_length_788_cov_1.323657_2_plen_66_part_00